MHQHFFGFREKKNQGTTATAASQTFYDLALNSWMNGD